MEVKGTAQRRHQGADSQELAHALGSLAATHLAAGNGAGAGRLLERALAIEELHGDSVCESSRDGTRALPHLLCRIS